MPHRRQRQPLIRRHPALRALPALLALLALACLGLPAAAWATPESQEKLRLLMQGIAQNRSQSQSPGAGVAQAATAAASATSAAPAAPATPDRRREREELLARGEAALGAADAQAAEEAFSRAGLIEHAADSEMGLVRAYMQAGQYRRALAFGAHTAGAHLDVVGGAALYAWLLHLGGQEAVAQRLLAQAHARAPLQPLVADVTRQLASPVPRAQGAMLATPARLAPYGPVPGLPTRAPVVASATLVGNGHLAIMPAEAVAASARYWVRNGLGQGAAARVESIDRAHGVALLRLGRPLPTPALSRAPGDAFPGSVSFAAEYPLSPDATPAWPVMKAGFMGQATDGQGGRLLDLGLAPGSPHGGPVFDHAGRLAGVVVRVAHASRVVGAQRLLQLFGEHVGLPASTAAGQRTPDTLYEPALQLALQVIRQAGAAGPGH